MLTHQQAAVLWIRGNKKIPELVVKPSTSLYFTGPMYRILYTPSAKYKGQVKQDREVISEPVVFREMGHGSLPYPFSLSLMLTLPLFFDI